MGEYECFANGENHLNSEENLECLRLPVESRQQVYRQSLGKALNMELSLVSVRGNEP